MSGRIGGQTTAQADFDGIHNAGGGGFSTRFSGWSGEFVTMDAQRRLQFKCSDSAIMKYREAATKYPTYPYPVFALAFCLKSRGDRSWEMYAGNAIGILEKTTRVPGHMPEQDGLLEEVRELLSKGAQ